VTQIIQEEFKVQELPVPGGLGTFAPISDKPNKGWDTPGMADFDSK
jgi:hypothetical protein